MVLSEGCLSEIFCNSNWAGPDEIDFGKEVPWAPGRQKASAVRAAAWIGKGLAMRGHNGVFVVASALLRLLLSEASGVRPLLPKFDSLVALYASASLVYP